MDCASGYVGGSRGDGRAFSPATCGIREYRVHTQDSCRNRHTWWLGPRGAQRRGRRGPRRGRRRMGLMPPPLRKRAASDDAREVQRQRAEDVRLPVVLEYHRNIARATAVVWDAPEQVVCEIVPGVLTLSAGDARNVLQLDWPLAPGRYMSEMQDGVQVVTLGAQSSAPLALVPQTPWMHMTTEKVSVLALACASCGSTLVQFGGAAMLRALPSENWEELVDAWMCHGDQRLNASVVQGRADVEHTRVPEPDQVWVGALLLRINSNQLQHVKLEQHKIPGPWEVR